MNPDLLELDLPFGEVPDLPPRERSPEENDRWQMENQRLRLSRGDRDSGFFPSDEPFTMEDWPLDREG